MIMLLQTTNGMRSSRLLSSSKIAAMDVGSILHMKEGLGETSYARNSSLQKKSMDALKHIIVHSAVNVYISKTPTSFSMADLGCSSGPNALCMAGDIIEAIDEKCSKLSQQTPEISVFLNDLPMNDFNAIFANFPEFFKKLKTHASRERDIHPFVFLAGVPGSFYGRLFLNNSLHFIYSCLSLHWLSQVPPGLFNNEREPINKGKMYISHTSPPAVAIAYFNQFQKDFTCFLKSRSAELVCGGQMVLAMLGRKSQDHNDKSTTFLWEVLAQSFALMVSQKIVNEEKVDAYNVPFYAPSTKEIEDEVQKEGSFIIDHIQTYEFNTSSGDATKDGRITSLAIRAIQESMICYHFGGEIIDTLFETYGRLLSESMKKEEIKGVHLVVVLRKSG
ncbi:probable methyltransferase TCM_000336 [Elaeis guineensis]|uniref:probable methyltransferase TCM_000336 n=1 Tax=Elaeis guineensis var. tenera TaxID=51953 RepID=UPI003C6D11EF